MKKKDMVDAVKGDISRILDLNFFTEITKENFTDMLEMLTQHYLILFERYGMEPPVIDSEFRYWEDE